MLFDGAVVTEEIVTFRAHYARIKHPRLKKVFKDSIEEYRVLEIALAEVRRAEIEISHDRAIQSIYNAARKSGNAKYFLEAALDCFERTNNLRIALKAGMAQALQVTPRKGKTARKRVARARKAK
jgi:hypothetical protein